MPTRPPRLLAGPYLPPSLRRGDRTFCLFRDTDVTVTSWTSAPTPDRAAVLGDGFSLTAARDGGMMPGIG
jgi:hypothetical protein